jgi:hypothetical protein
MTAVDAGCFAVGVFQDAAWAARGVAALGRAGLVPASLSIIGRDTPEIDALIRTTFDGSGESLTIAGVGAALARGPIVRVLQGETADLASLGLSRTLRRAGFLPHDARIYDALVARGGVLVAIHSEPRAADALAVLHAYGGGNAAIGAWAGRL